MRGEGKVKKLLLSDYLGTKILFQNDANRPYPCRDLFFRCCSVVLATLPRYSRYITLGMPVPVLR